MRVTACHLRQPRRPKYSETSYVLPAGTNVIKTTFHSISRDTLIDLLPFQAPVEYCYSYVATLDCNIIYYAKGKFDIDDAKDEPVSDRDRFLVLIVLGSGVEPLANLIPELQSIVSQHSIFSRQYQVVNSFNRLNIHHVL